jgi:phosphate transport system substrate-binding protein
LCGGDRAPGRPRQCTTTGIGGHSHSCLPASTHRRWRHSQLGPRLSQEGYGQKYHPDVTFSDNLVSSAAATGALFTNTADLGILGREIRPMEVAGYTRVMKQKPFPLEG